MVKFHYVIQKFLFKTAACFPSSQFTVLKRLLKSQACGIILSRLLSADVFDLTDPYDVMLDYFRWRFAI